MNINDFTKFHIPPGPVTLQVISASKILKSVGFKQILMKQNNSPSEYFVLLHAKDETGYREYSNNFIFNTRQVFINLNTPSRNEPMSEEEIDKLLAMANTNDENTSFLALDILARANLDTINLYKDKIMMSKVFLTCLYYSDRPYVNLLIDYLYAR